MLKRKFAILITVILAVLLMLSLSACGEKTIKVESLEDMNTPDYRLALLPGTTADFQAQEKIPKCKFEYLNSNSDAQAAVLAGRVDGYAFDSTNLQRFVNANGEVELLDVTLGKAYIYAEFKKGDTETTRKFNEFVKKLKEDGTFQEMKKYWIEDGKTTMPDLSALKPENPEGTFVIATETLCEPYTFVGNDGEYVGFDLEMGTRFAYSLGMNVRIDNMTFNAFLPALASGKADMALCEISHPTDNVESPDVEFSEPYMECDTAIVAKKQDGDIISNLKNRFIASFITDNRWKLIVEGLGMTLLISIVAFVLGAVWGGVLCVMRRSRAKVLRGFEKFYSTVAMGLPIMMVLLIFYYLIFASVNIPPALVAIIAFALTEGAVFCSMYDTGINSVDPQQYEAGLALGFKPSEAFRRIVMPQAARTIYPLFCNEFTALIKATAIVGYIAIVDLTKASDIIRSRAFDAFFPMIATAIIYFIIIYLSLILLRKLGKRSFEKKQKNGVKGDKGRIAKNYENNAFAQDEKRDGSQPIISIRNLSKSFGDNHVLKNITRDVYPGEVISVIGPSGCGKSTLIRCFNRMTDATEGSVVIDGHDIYAPGADVCAIRQKMGMVFQSYNLFPHMSCMDNIMLAPVKIRNMSMEDAKAKALGLLEIVGMESYADAYPDTLSGGQKQRVAIARALAMDPEIVLFDEPTSALDPNMSVEVFNVIRTLAEKGTTMIVVTHSMDFASSISSRVFYMDEKGIYEDDTPEVIFNNPNKEKTREFIYRTKTFTTTCTKDMDLYNFQTEVGSFLQKRAMTFGQIRNVNLVCEEVLYNALFESIDSPIEVTVSHSDVSGEVSVTFCNDSIDMDIVKNFRDSEEVVISRTILRNLSYDLDVEDGRLTVKVRPEWNNEQ